MNYRILGKTNLKISEISLGTWQVGGKWGSGFDHQNAETILHKAIDQGINFIDTADVYEAGLSETAVGKVIRERSEEIYIASKCGRQINPHVAENYIPEALANYVEDSLRRTGLETLDLIQLHCPPGPSYYQDEIFEMFDRLEEQGKIRNLGVSVETVDEALQAISYPNVRAIQIIFNIFRQKPARIFFPEAKKHNIGILARVPLASGLLTGKFSNSSSFDKSDHRNFNREGKFFDKGETFSGVDFDLGLKAVDEIKALFPEMENLAPIALQWVLKFPEVSCVIPGASRPGQVDSNLETLNMPSMSQDKFNQINEIYERLIKNEVEQLW